LEGIDVAFQHGFYKQHSLNKLYDIVCQPAERLASINPVDIFEERSSAIGDEIVCCEAT
jgi:hypothetical protein